MKRPREAATSGDLAERERFDMSKRKRWQPPHPAKDIGENVRQPATPRRISSRGVPTYSSGEELCCWPKCPKDRYAAVIPLCEAHLGIAHVLFVENNGWQAAWYGPTARFVLDGNDGLPVAQPEPDRAPPVEGTVYFLRIGGYIKIGWTSDLGKRMKGYPPDTSLLAVMPGLRTDEQQLHRKFAHLTTHGREWYPLAPQITEHIQRVITEHGDPPAVDFSAKKKSQRIVGPRLNRYVGGEHRGPGTGTARLVG